MSLQISTTYTPLHKSFDDEPSTTIIGTFGYPIQILATTANIYQHTSCMPYLYHQTSDESYLLMTPITNLLLFLLLSYNSHRTSINKYDSASKIRKIHRHFGTQKPYTQLSYWVPLTKKNPGFKVVYMYNELILLLYLITFLNNS